MLFSQLALTAATPVYRGYLTDVDCRWNVISASVDCRTREERGLEPLRNDKFVIPKSRYDSVDCYLSECGARLVPKEGFDVCCPSKNIDFFF